MNRSVDEMKVVITDVRGIRMRLVAYTRALELCAKMNYETEVLDFIDRIEEGAVLYDLGACEGRFSLYSALRKVHCYAFEPEAMNYRAMLQNIELNGERAKQYLKPLNLAVGAGNGRSVLKIGQPWAGGHHRVVSGAPNRIDLSFDTVSQQEVTMVSLDQFISANNLPRPDYLKVDIDGSELPFLEGAIETLASPQLKGIIFELCKRDESYHKAISVLASCGFRAGRHCQVEPELFNVFFER